MISDFKIFPNDACETADFWNFVHLTTILHLLQRKTPLFLIFSFYCCLVKED